MVNFFIGFGKLSSIHLYLLYNFIFKFLSDFILSFSLIKGNVKYGIFLFQPELNSHTLIKCFYKYIGFIIFGIIFLNCQKYNKNNKSTQKSKELIYNNKMDDYNASIIHLFIIGILYVCFSIFMNVAYSIGLYDFDLWPFNIIFTILFMLYYFSIHIYNHQKYSLLFIVSIDLILLILATFFPTNDNSYNIIKILFNDKLFSIAVFLIFILNGCIISYSRVLVKVILEYNFISRYSIITLIGIFGFILTSILIAITSKFKCGSSERYEIICNIYERYNQDNTTPKNTYYDSIPILFKNLKNEKELYFWVEVIIIYPLYLIIRFMELNYELLTIYYLNPIYVLISDSFYYGLISLLSFLLNYKGNNTKSILCLIANIISFTGYSIYVEIIELKFCKLSKNLRKNIIERSRLDSLIENNDNYFESSENDEDEIKDNENLNNIELGI